MDKYILLWLEAPLQSWGADSKFGRRDSLSFPTKSGITGLVLCAMGASGEQSELLKEMAVVKHTVFSYIRSSQQVKGRDPLLVDFHMVGSGYDEKNVWQTRHIPKKADGGAAVGGGTKMTYRYYLQDAAFGIICKTPPELVTLISDAFLNPVYDLYLGRKNCVPTDFIFRGVFDAEDDAQRAVAAIAAEKDLRENFRVLDGEYQGGDILTLNDVPVQFGENKKYRDRRVTVVPV